MGSSGSKSFSPTCEKNMGTGKLSGKKKSSPIIASTPAAPISAYVVKSDKKGNLGGVMTILDSSKHTQTFSCNMYSDPMTCKACCCCPCLASNRQQCPTLKYEPIQCLCDCPNSFQKSQSLRYSSAGNQRTICLDGQTQSITANDVTRKLSRAPSAQSTKSILKSNNSIMNNYINNNHHHLDDPGTLPRSGVKEDCICKSGCRDDGKDHDGENVLTHDVPHLSAVLPTDNNCRKKEKVYGCEACEESFGTESQLISHQELYRHFCCVQCDSIFGTQRALSYHRRQMSHYEFVFSSSEDEDEEVLLEDDDYSGRTVKSRKKSDNGVKDFRKGPKYDRLMRQYNEDWESRDSAGWISSAESLDSFEEEEEQERLL